MVEIGERVSRWMIGDRVESGRMAVSGLRLFLYLCRLIHVIGHDRTRQCHKQMLYRYNNNGGWRKLRRRHDERDFLCSDTVVCWSLGRAPAADDLLLCARFTVSNSMGSVGVVSEEN